MKKKSITIMAAVIISLHLQFDSAVHTGLGGFDSVSDEGDC